MNNAVHSLHNLAAEEKRARLKALLREKAAGNGLVPSAGDRSQSSTSSTPAQPDIPKQFYRFELSPEYQSWQQQFRMLEQIEVTNPYFKASEAVVGSTTRIGGRELISYAGYNYLGFSGDERVTRLAKEAIDRYGTSVSASRIATGERPIHDELEQALASLLGSEAALVFVSGHATNVTVIGHLLGPGDLIVYDALSHNSILQGCVLSGARCMPFPHNDWQTLDTMLAEQRHHYQRVLIVIEGVYSMDGDIANLPQFIACKRRHKTWLMVDEAHSIGVLGRSGGGIGEYYDVDRQEVDLWMGTLSKSFASCGGYIAGSRALVEYLKYTAPGFLYSVGISPANAGAALAAVQLLQQEPERVACLQHNARLFLRLAQEAGLHTGLSNDTPIVPLIVGDSARCLRLAHALFEHGINVQPILYPAVAEDQARLRFFITCQHHEEQIRSTIAAAASELRRLIPNSEE